VRQWIDAPDSIDMTVPSSGVVDATEDNVSLGEPSRSLPSWRAPFKSCSFFPPEFRL